MVSVGFSINRAKLSSPSCMCVSFFAVWMLRELVGAFIPVPLLTHGLFREQPQRQRRSRPRGSKCSSSAGGTSLSLERNLGNRKDHTAPIIKLNITELGVLYNAIAVKIKVSVISLIQL